MTVAAMKGGTRQSASGLRVCNNTSVDFLEEGRKEGRKEGRHEDRKVVITHVVMARAEVKK